MWGNKKGKKKRDAVCTEGGNAGTPQLKMQMPRRSYARPASFSFFFLEQKNKSGGASICVGG